MNKGNVYFPKQKRWHMPIWWSRLKLRWPFVIWVLAGVLAMFLYRHGGEFDGISGAVDTIRQRVAPLETAHLKRLLVEPGQEVQNGDVVAIMNDAIIQAEIKALQTKMAVEKLQLEQQFAREVTRTQSDLRKALIKQAEGTAELEVIDQEISRLDPLFKQGLVQAGELTRLRSRQAALQKVLEFYPDTIQALKAVLGSSLARQEHLSEWLSGKIQPLEELRAENVDLSLDVNQAQISLLEKRRKEYVLRANCSGVISRVYRDPGDVVSAGETILTVTAFGPIHIIGFVPESNVRDIHVGMTAYILRDGGGGGSLMDAQVTALAPDIQNLPGRVTPQMGGAGRGRRITLLPTEPDKLIPGESVSIRFGDPVLSLFIEQIRSYFLPNKAAKEETTGPTKDSQK